MFHTNKQALYIFSEFPLALIFFSESKLAFFFKKLVKLGEMYSLIQNYENKGGRVYIYIYKYTHTTQQSYSPFF